LLEDAQISFFCAYQLIYMGNFGYKYQSCGFYTILFARINPRIALIAL
jgi:hypothetical protein